MSVAQATLPTRLSFLSVAIWWLVFSIPLLLRVREPYAAGAWLTRGRAQVRQLPIRGGRSLNRDRAIIKSLSPGTRDATRVWIYNDGIGN